MPSILSKSDFCTEWQRFQATHPKLLKDLRDPQLDAMFWLTMGKHVVSAWELAAARLYRSCALLL